METRVLRSARRRKTVSAVIRDNVLVVMAPARMPEKQLREVIEELRGRLERRLRQERAGRREDLVRAFDRLNRRYFGGKLSVSSIRYSSVAPKRYGSCRPSCRSIRIARSLAGHPRWVRDYVLVHEMAHLLEPNHGRAFWELVGRYPLSERARGYLTAMDMREDGPPGAEPVQGTLSGGLEEAPR